MNGLSEDSLLSLDGGLTKDVLMQIQEVAVSVLNKMNPIKAHLVVTMGDQGVILASQHATFSFHHFPAEQNVRVRNATGAGDSLTGGFVHALLQGWSEKEAIRLGMKAARQSLECPDRAVSPTLSI